jgi:hypothetical protein
VVEEGRRERFRGVCHQVYALGAGEWGGVPEEGSADALAAVVAVYGHSSASQSAITPVK